MKEEPFDWELYSQNPDKYQVFTRGGHRVFKVYKNDEDESSKYPLSALVEDIEGDTDTWRYTFTGAWDVVGKDLLDLTIMKSEISEPKLVEQWDPSFKPYYTAVWLAEEDGQKAVRYSTQAIDNAQKVLELGKEIEEQKPEFKFLGVINLADHPQIKAMLEAEGIVKLIPAKP